MPMKRISLALVALLGLTLLAACGGDDGGGDQDAFCNALDDLSQQVADGDLGTDDGLDDVTKTVNDLFEAADDDQADAVETVGNEVQDAKPEDADDTFETVDDELGDFADDCDVELAAPTTTEASTTTTEETTTTTETVDTSDTADTQGNGDDRIEVTAPTAVPGDVADQQTAGACFGGDFDACDTLFNNGQSNGDQADATYGDSCGGRIPNGSGKFCTQVFPGAQAPGADVQDTATAGACFNGDMNACDQLLNSDHEPDQRYGFFCGGRIDETLANTQELCPAIFGDQAVA
jgi:hypothetical protein